jgi:hypothetical protein
MAAIRVTLPCRSNTISLYPATRSGLNVLNQASYGETIQDWQAELPYLQKLAFGDRITIQVHSQFDGILPAPPPPSELYLCDKFKTRIAPLMTAGAYVGFVYNINNKYNHNGTPIPLVTQTWSFTFGVEGFFTLEFVNKMTGEADVSHYSEIIDCKPTQPNTLYYEYSYNSNISDDKNVIISPWWEDFNTNTIPFDLRFGFRAEGYINKYVPKVVNVGYYQQSYEQRQIKTKQVTTWTLEAGAISLGIPYWVLQKLTEILLADRVYINNFQYKIFNPGGASAPTDLWKIKDLDISPLVWASCPIVWASESQQAMVTPTPIPYGGIFTDEFGDEFA